MSKLYKPTKYTPKQLERQQLNILHGVHDMFCFCPHPLKHCLLTIAEKGEQIQLKRSEYNQLQQCLTITEEDITPEDGFDGGDLEKLFAEPFGEEEDAEG